MSKRSVKLMYCVFAILAIMLLLLKSSYAGQVDTAVVNLTINTWMSISVEKDTIEMEDVRSDWFGHEYESVGNSYVSVYGNTKMRLTTPKQVQLDHETLPAATQFVTANVDLTSGTPVGKGQSDTEKWIIYNSGSYQDTTQLWLSIKKVWTSADVAGTYYGTITLYLTQEP